MNILYMNQGGGGNWGAIPYKNFDIICLAEGSVEKEGFITNYQSHTKPAMTVSTRENEGRLITAARDLDEAVQEVRPFVTFQVPQVNIRVVFFHLKSGNKKYATEALAHAVERFLVLTGNNADVPTLWIGDFNRSTYEPLLKLEINFKNDILFMGGGVSKWDLDWAVKTGDWTNLDVKAREASRSGDNQHVAIGVSINRRD
ncbi:hypothetical protein [Ferruginibacter sp. HRS2-29]|uniref:hypothetical protein n=1 Tax=Ferruginibacter sp. HRS2-29 TaxID=2487334 RepID=UPI0020CBDD02|nr:hypothetical protein [Ferruginibacter sp. HRS2-29]MCP9752343.1 hypothetical protein [Ferruginibacter sp. HRS2-29]